MKCSFFLTSVMFFKMLISRDMFNKLQAQRWWADNYDKVKELYNVQKLSRNAFPLPTPPISEDEVSLIESLNKTIKTRDYPLTMSFVEIFCSEGKSRVPPSRRYSCNATFEQRTFASYRTSSSWIGCLLILGLTRP